MWLDSALVWELLPPISEIASRAARTATSRAIFLFDAFDMAMTTGHEILPVSLIYILSADVHSPPSLQRKAARLSGLAARRSPPHIGIRMPRIGVRSFARRMTGA